MRLIVYYIITLFCCLPLTLIAQSKFEREKILNRRLDKIEYYHIGVGMDAAMNKNYQFSPKVFVGIGSSRNLFNVDMGLKLTFSNVFGESDDEYIRHYAMPIFVAGSINAVRWKQKNLYVGAEISYNVALGSRHIVFNQLLETDIASIAKNHFAWQGKLGFRNKDWDISAYYEYDLSPAIDQKYVYESPAYDYFNVYGSIFERWRIGVSATYNFRF